MVTGIFVGEWGKEQVCQALAGLIKGITYLLFWLQFQCGPQTVPCGRITWRVMESPDHWAPPSRNSDSAGLGEAKNEHLKCSKVVQVPVGLLRISALRVYIVIVLPTSYEAQVVHQEVGMSPSPAALKEWGRPHWYPGTAHSACWVHTLWALCRYLLIYFSTRQTSVC